MDNSARTEYPAVLASLPPHQAVQALQDRVKRIHRINTDVADWLQERRRVEEQYALGLRKLLHFRAPNAQTELGVFETPWARIMEAVDTIAESHNLLAERIEQDIEHPLRVFHHNKDATLINTMASNLASVVKEMDDARDKADKLNKKRGKGSTQKVDAAASKLESASQQWESQSPYIFESLQSLDELRINQMRDLLTQYQSLESDQAQRTQDRAVETLAQMIEISTETEVHQFVESVSSSRPKPLSRSSNHPPTGLPSQGSSVAASQQSSHPPADHNAAPASAPSTASQEPSSQRQPAGRSADEDVAGPGPEQSASPAPGEHETKSRLRRLGTILGGRRRQSMVALSPSKGSNAGFGRLGGGQGRGLSPGSSTTDLRNNKRLAPLDEGSSPKGSTEQPLAGAAVGLSLHQDNNGLVLGESLLDSPVPCPKPPASGGGGGVNGTHAALSSNAALPPVPPPSKPAQSPGQTNQADQDSQGFSVPPPMNDPISEAQREAACEEANPMFNLNIANKPIDEEDPAAKQAAMSSVSNTLRMGPATRRAGTVRGRRDVRNTIYVPSPNVSEAQTENSVHSLPGSQQPPPSLGSAAASASRPAPAAALASEASIATSDSQSIRSGTSLNSLAQVRHPEMTKPGLNVSVIETVSATFEEGLVKKVSIAGEIALVNNISDVESSKARATIRIDNFTNLERIGPNRIFVQNVPDEPEQFTLDLSHLTRTSTAFSYKVFTEDADGTSLGKHAPLMLRPAWKSQGDKLGLLLQYQLNPTSELTGPVTLHNVVFVATYTGKATGAQTKPTGTHLKDKQLVYWRLGDVTLTGDMHKIVCRIVGSEGAEPTPGQVEARWEYVASGSEAIGSGISLSRFQEAKGKQIADDDPFADENTASSLHTWVPLPSSRKLVSGKYESK